MTTRLAPRRWLAALAIGFALSACKEQPAGPTLELTPTNTGSVKATVLRDTAASGAAKYAPAINQRVSLYSTSDTINPLRQANTNAQGQVLFVGLTAGTYFVRPSIRLGSRVATGGQDTLRIAGRDTLAADTSRIRLGASISGIVDAEYFNQLKFNQKRFAGVTVNLSRETIVGSGIFVLAAKTTTDATGAYSFIVNPGPEKYLLSIRSDSIPALVDDTLVFQGTKPVASRGLETIQSTSGIAPDATITRNFVFNYPSAVSGTVYRDANGNNVKDVGEVLLANDTVRVQLRDAGGTRVLATAIANFGKPTYTFASLASGTYKLTIDPVASRITAGSAPFKTPTYTVVITNATVKVTQDVGT